MFKRKWMGVDEKERKSDTVSTAEIITQITSQRNAQKTVENDTRVSQKKDEKL